MTPCPLPKEVLLSDNLQRIFRRSAHLKLQIKTSPRPLVLYVLEFLIWKNFRLCPSRRSRTLQISADLFTPYAINRQYLPASLLCSTKWSHGVWIRLWSRIIKDFPKDTAFSWPKRRRQTWHHNMWCQVSHMADGESLLLTPFSYGA